MARTIVYTDHQRQAVREVDVESRLSKRRRVGIGANGWRRSVVVEDQIGIIVRVEINGRREASVSIAAPDLSGIVEVVTNGARVHSHRKLEGKVMRHDKERVEPGRIISVPCVRFSNGMKSFQCRLEPDVFSTIVSSKNLAPGRSFHVWYSWTYGKFWKRANLILSS